MSHNSCGYGARELAFIFSVQFSSNNPGLVTPSYHTVVRQQTALLRDGHVAFP